MREDGAIFISIDGNELADLLYILHEIFGERNFIECISWYKKVSPANDAKWFSNDHEYLVVFAQAKEGWRPNRLKRNDKQTAYYRNPDNDARGDWNSVAYTCNKSRRQRPNLYYPIIHPNTGDEVWPKETAVWAYSYDVYQTHEAQDLLYWGVDGGAKSPRYKKFLSDAGDIVPRSIWPYADVGHTQEATSEFRELFPDGGFDTPKPTRLIKRILQLATDKDSLVLDCFAGSGTTGHAVMQMNAEDGGTRRFVLVEMEPQIARNITAERLRRVIGGYGDKPGLGGAFTYATLGDALIDADGQLGAGVSYTDLARYIFHKETGETLADVPDGGGDGFLGECGGVAVFLLWGKGAERVLDADGLRRLAARSGLKTVYADACPVPADRLARANIRFVQTQYALAAS